MYFRSTLHHMYDVTMDNACYGLDVLDMATHWLDHVNRINPFFLTSPTSSPPSQYFLNPTGNSNPSISPPSPRHTPFSRSATSSLGMAAAVAFRVWANGIGESASVSSARCRI